jgi:hypothetical protein
MNYSKLKFSYAELKMGDLGDLLGHLSQTFLITLLQIQITPLPHGIVHPGQQVHLWRGVQPSIFSHREVRPSGATVQPSSDRGCQIFLGSTYQNGKKYAKRPYNEPNGHKIYQMEVK